MGTDMKKSILQFWFGVWTLFVLVGCSGGEADYSLEDVNPDRQGKFIDDAVEGLEYRRSNGEEGVTAKGGTYIYKDREMISFHIGALELGEEAAASIITPRELAQNTNVIEDPAINNRVRFMLALDQDDQRIGIQIDNALRTQAEQWAETIDFTKSESNFTLETQRVTNGDIINLPTAYEANEHFGKTLRCAYSGAYQGAWDVPDSNESSGYVGVMVQANGFVVVMGDGQTIGDQNDSVVYVLADHDINTRSYTFRTDAYYYYNRADKILDLVPGGAVITGGGVNVAYDKIEGSFVNGEEQGSYSVTRADASNNAAYRFTGFGDIPSADGYMTIGMIIMDVDPDGRISGLIHDIRDTSIQPRLQGTADFVTGAINISVEMPDETSLLSGTINFDDTSNEQNLTWTNQDANVTYGRVRLDGCQLQAIE